MICITMRESEGKLIFIKKSLTPTLRNSLEYKRLLYTITLLKISRTNKINLVNYNYDIEIIWRLAMENLLLLTQTLEFIEQNLTEDIKTEDIAANLYCSKSNIEKLFKYVTRISIRHYIIRRRMSLAAKEISQTKEDISLLDLAFKYGYSSNEAFTRAFKSVWHVSPSEYKCNPKRYELFPAFKFDPELMEDMNMMGCKKVDISELYDLIKERKNCYFVGVDIKSLIPINDISYEAGDIAIMTAMSRLEEAVSEDDIVFRVGGDEFVALTNSDKYEYAQEIIGKVLAKNGEPIIWNGVEIPLSLYATFYKVENNNIRYAELFKEIQKKLDVVKAE